MTFIVDSGPITFYYMHAIIPIIITVLLLIACRLLYGFLFSTFKKKVFYISTIYDILWAVWFLLYPLVFDLFLLQDWDYRNQFILTWGISTRVMLWLFIITGLPVLLSYLKKITYNAFFISTWPYFWIGNVIYFTFLLPYVLLIINGIL